MTPAPQLLTVRAWPERMALAVQDIRSVQGVTVIAIATPVTTNRSTARTLVRTALRETLGELLDQPAASITLVSRPGQAIALAASPIPLDLALSHAPGVSVAAMCKGGAVGIDVMRLEDGVDDAPDWLRVAHDYLGPQVTASLQALPAAQVQAAFIQAWTRFEACLKCLGLGLTEWSPTLEKQLATCRASALDFSEAGLLSVTAGTRLFGAVALRVPRPGSSGQR